MFYVACTSFSTLSSITQVYCRFPDTEWSGLRILSSFANCACANFSCKNLRRVAALVEIFEFIDFMFLHKSLLIRKIFNTVVVLLIIIIFVSGRITSVFSYQHCAGVALFRFPLKASRVCCYCEELILRSCYC